MTPHDSLLDSRHYAELVASVDGIVWELDIRSQQFTFVSNQAERLLGYPRQQWYAPGFWVDHLHPDDRLWASQFCERATAERRNHDFEYRMIAADGRTVWLRDIVNVMVDGGQVTRLRGVMVDITEQKRAGEAQRAHVWFLESMDRVNRALQGTSDLEQVMSDLLDAVLEIFACDRAWLMYPCDPQADFCSVPMERTRPEYPGAAAKGVRIAVDPPLAGLFRGTLNTDGPLWCGEGSGHPIPDEAAKRFAIRSELSLAVHPKLGEPYLFGLHQCSRPRAWTDDEKRLFQEIGRRLGDALTSLLMFRSLQDRERKLETSQRMAHIGYWDIDLDHGEVLLSCEACRIFGVASSEAQQTHPQWRAVWERTVHPDDRDRVVQVGQAALSRGGPYEVEYRIVRPDGEVRVVHSRAEIASDDTGRPLRAFGMVQDITDLKRLEQQLRQAQKMEAIGRLAGGVAHDFNNLLTVVSSNSQLALSGLDPAAPARELLLEVQEAADRAASLTARLLAFSRRQVLQPKVVDVNALIEDLCALLRRLIGSDVAVGLALDAGVGCVKVDPAQLEQAIVNLAVNARDAMPGGGRLTIETRGALFEPRHPARPEVAPGSYVVISVRDSGHGMDESTRARIFEPFFTTKAAGAGSGLGLAMVYGFVKQSGGYIYVESEPDQGAVFDIYLPAVDGAAPSGRRERVAPEAMAGGTETVLVVEDEDAVRRLVRKILRANGYTVLEARTGEEALTVAGGHPGAIDLLLTDMVMPGMNGRELADRLLESRPATRVLFMSGYTDHKLFREGGLAPGRSFLPKPFNAAILAGKVREALDPA